MRSRYTYNTDGDRNNDSDSETAPGTGGMWVTGGGYVARAGNILCATILLTKQ